MRLSYADIFQHNTSHQAHDILQPDKDFKGGEQNVLPKRWNEDSFTRELFCS